MLISVVFSFRNEEDVLAQLVARTVAVLSDEPEDYELIFVNDDSTDRSLDTLLSLRQSNPRIKIVNMARRFGVSEGVLAGMRLAAGDAVIYMDADLQDPPELLPQLLREWRAGSDVVHTQRSSRQGESAFKMLVTRMGYHAISAGSSMKLPIEVGDFKLLSRRAVTHLLDLKESNPYLRGLIVWLGFRQVTVPYERSARGGGVAHFPLWSKNPWVSFVSGVTSFSFAPILLPIAIGMLGLVAALLIGLVGLIVRPVDPSARLGVWLTFLMTAYWGATMLAVGFLGIYVARIYKDVRGRPRYIVESAVGFGDEPEAGASTVTAKPPRTPSS